MGRYRIRVATGSWVWSGSFNRVQLWLVGARGEAELELQLRPTRGQVEEFEHDVPDDLGPLQFVKLRKHHSLVDDAWFCDRITVRGPGASAEEAAFPCYRWVQGEGVLTLPEGTERRVPCLKPTLFYGWNSRNVIPGEKQYLTSYVEGIVSLHYKMDEAVKEDLELQSWCREITEIGLQGAQDQGFPISLQSRDQLCHFVTTCIFTCTGQHSSVHMGQLDWYSWVPNAPSTMRLPPPTTKDATLETVMATLPNIHQASLQMSFTWQLGRRQPVMVALGQHEEEYFGGPEPKAVLNKFRKELAALDKEIEIRNAKLDLPHEYLRPSLVENSVTI